MAPEESCEPNKPLALLKVLGGTFVMVAAGIGMYLIGRYKAKRLRLSPPQTLSS